MSNEQRIIATASSGEAVTGLSLLVAPSLVAGLLLGAEPMGIALVISRVAGIALISLGIACWPNRDARASDKPCIGLLIYSSLTALVLAQFGIAGPTSGILLWPVILLHFIFAVLLAWVWSRRRTGKTTEG